MEHDGNGFSGPNGGRDVPISMFALTVAGCKPFAMASNGRYCA